MSSLHLLPGSPVGTRVSALLHPSSSPGTWGGEGAGQEEAPGTQWAALALRSQGELERPRESPVAKARWAGGRLRTNQGSVGQQIWPFQGLPLIKAPGSPVSDHLQEGAVELGAAGIGLREMR